MHLAMCRCVKQQTSSWVACRRRPAMQGVPASRSSSLPYEAGSGGAAAAPAAAAAAAQTRTCRRCKQQFDPSTNGKHSCRHHSAMYTGGEVSKVCLMPSGRLCQVLQFDAGIARHSAGGGCSRDVRCRPFKPVQALGFCRASDRPEDQLRAVVGRTGLIRFWDCCGAEEEEAPGCCASRHVTYDDP